MTPQRWSSGLPAMPVSPEKSSTRSLYALLRLGSRLRGPAGTPVGALKRVLISNVTCHAPLNDMPSIISGIPGHPVEDIQISNCYFLQKGGAEMAALQPSEQPSDYPEPALFGPLPAQHFYYGMHATLNSAMLNLEA
jgi:hypothetical protein